MKKLKEYSVWVVAFIFAVAVITVYKTFDNFGAIWDVVKIIISAFEPFFWAFVIAYILNLPAMRIKRFLDGINSGKVGFLGKHSHGISIAIVYIVATGVVFWGLYYLLPKMYASIVNLLSALPGYINAVVEWIYQNESIDNVAVENAINGMVDGINRYIGSLDLSQFSKYAEGVVNVTSGVFSVVVAIIASVYMLLDKDNIKSSFVKVSTLFMKDESKLEFLSHTRDVNEIFTNYIYARLICCVIMAIATTIVLSLLKIEYALILGLFIGAMDMIPYFGSIIATVVAIFVAFITNGPTTGITTGIILLIMQQIDGNILGPKVMGNSLEIKPLWVIVAVTVGGSLFGFVGMLISVPVVAVLRILFLELLKMYEEQKEKKNEG